MLKWFFALLLFLPISQKCKAGQISVSLQGDSIGTEVRGNQLLLRYKVSAGETLYSLVREYDVERTELEELNPALKSGLKAGMLLLIPIGQKTPFEKAKSPRTTTVKEKESYLNIIEGYKVLKSDEVLDIHAPQPREDTSIIYQRPDRVEWHKDRMGAK